MRGRDFVPDSGFCCTRLWVVDFLPSFQIDFLALRACSSPGVSRHLTRWKQVRNIFSPDFISLASQVSTPVSRILSHWVAVSAVLLSPWAEGCVAPPCHWGGACVASLSPQDSSRPTAPHSPFHLSALSQTHRYFRQRQTDLCAFSSSSSFCSTQNYKTDKHNRQIHHEFFVSFMLMFTVS